MMDHPSANAPATLTVAVCTFNRAALLTRMLASIRGQTCQDFDVLVLDDCSSDGTSALCEPLVGERFRYVRHATNIGFNANYNQAIALARTSYVLLTHDDDYMDATFIDYLMKGIVRYPEAILVTTNVRLVGEDRTAPASASPLVPSVPNALKLTEDVVFAPGEYAKARYWRGLDLYCPTFCFHRRRCLEAQIAFDPIGPGSDVLIGLRANLVGPLAVLAETHFNVCTHPGQDHASVVNDLTSGYRLDRVTVPIARREPTLAAIRPVAQFSLAYHFAKAATAALLDLPDRPATAPTETLEQRFARHVATLPPELLEPVFACGRNRVAARLFGHTAPLKDIPRHSAEEWIRSVPQLSPHLRKWHLANFSALDRLEDLLAGAAPLPSIRPRFLADRTILIWGVSYLGIILAEVLHRLRITVAGFVDRNPRLAGARYRDLVCRNWPDSLAAHAAPDRELLVFTGVEGALDLDLALDLLPTHADAPRCVFRSWRTAVDLIEAVAAGRTAHD